MNAQARNNRKMTTPGNLVRLLEEEDHLDMIMEISFYSVMSSFSS